jgi:hypothetical protein
MSYEINVYHLNINVGDATLIIATQNNVVKSTVLIDGGIMDKATKAVDGAT